MPAIAITRKDWGRIAQMRHEGLTQAETATEIGCSIGSIKRLETQNENYKVFRDEFVRGYEKEAGYQEGRKARREKEGKL